MQRWATFKSLVRTPKVILSGGSLVFTAIVAVKAILTGADFLSAVEDTFGFLAEVLSNPWSLLVLLALAVWHLYSAPAALDAAQAQRLTQQTEAFRRALIPQTAVIDHYIQWRRLEVAEDQLSKARTLLAKQGMLASQYHGDNSFQVPNRTAREGPWPDCSFHHIKASMQRALELIEPENIHMPDEVVRRWNLDSRNGDNQIEQYWFDPRDNIEFLDAQRRNEAALEATLGTLEEALRLKRAVLARQKPEEARAY